MTRRQLLLVAIAALAVLGGVLAILLSGNLIGIMVLVACGMIVVAVVGTWLRGHLVETLAGMNTKRDDLETRIAEWVQSPKSRLSGSRDLDWDRFYARMDEDARYRTLKAQYEDATSPLDREMAFTGVRDLVKNQVRAMRDATEGADGE